MTDDDAKALMTRQQVEQARERAENRADLRPGGAGWFTTPERDLQAEHIALAATVEALAEALRGHPHADRHGGPAYCTACALLAAYDGAQP